MVIWRKFGQYLYIGMASFFFFFFFLSVLFGYIEIVDDIRNTSDKLNFFLLSATFSTHPNTYV